MDDFGLQRVLDALTRHYGEIPACIASEGLDVVRTLISKNIDYGSSFAEPPLLMPALTAEAGCWCRLSDKVARLISLNSSGTAEVDESIDDTLRDLAGYAILLLVARNAKNTNSEQ